MNGVLVSYQLANYETSPAIWVSGHLLNRKSDIDCLGTALQPGQWHLTILP